MTKVLDNFNKGEWVYGVVHYRNGRKREKLFNSEDAAREYFERLKRNKERAALVRVQDPPLWWNVANAQIKWLNRSIRVLDAVLVLGAVLLIFGVWCAK